MVVAKALDGLPAYGPRAISFPKADAFREGFVVEFTDDSGGVWTGNFEKFGSKPNEIHPELGPEVIVIVAGGQGYIIDTIRRELVCKLGCDIKHIWFEEELGAFIATNGLWFECFDGDLMRWCSRRVSWDSVRNLVKDNLTVAGEASDPTTTAGSWRPFLVDLRTGAAEGGSFPTEPFITIDKEDPCQST